MGQLHSVHPSYRSSPYNAEIRLTTPSRLSAVIRPLFEDRASSCVALRQIAQQTADTRTTDFIRAAAFTLSTAPE